MLGVDAQTRIRQPIMYLACMAMIILSTLFAQRYTYTHTLKRIYPLTIELYLSPLVVLWSSTRLTLLVLSSYSHRTISARYLETSSIR